MRIIHIVISIGLIIAGIGWISAGTATMIPIIAIVGGAGWLYMIFSDKNDWDYRIDEIDSEIEVLEDQIKYLQTKNPNALSELKKVYESRMEQLSHK